MRLEYRVPLSNEDEWGWEDNAKKDIELGGKPSNNIDSSSDLNSVLANSVHSGASSNNDSHRKSVGSDTTFQTTNVSGVRLTSSTANKRPSVIKTSSGKAFEPTPLENIASEQQGEIDVHCSCTYFCSGQDFVHRSNDFELKTHGMKMMIGMTTKIMLETAEPAHILYQHQYQLQHRLHQHRLLHQLHLRQLKNY